MATNGGGGGGASGARQPQQLDLAALGAQQLLGLKKQLDAELEHLNSSYAQLRAAQARFNDCLRTLRDGLAARAEGTPILVPLTSSLYVPGELASVDVVLVDVGTGFYVEKSVPEASAFYKERAAELAGNLNDLEAIMQGKSGNLRVVEDVLRQKVAQENAGQGQAAMAAAS